MQEQRNFKIINLTGLDTDESEDIVQILNEVMNIRNMESGKKAIEFIVRDYKLKTERFKEERKELKDEIEKLKKENLDQFDVLKKHISVSTSLKELHFYLSLV